MRSSTIISICKSFYFVVFLTVGTTLHAQLNTLSPYSRYGVGISRTATFNGSVGLSGTGQAWRPSNYRPEVYDSLARSGATFNDRNTNYINVANPASFSNYSLTTYEAGLYTQTVNYDNNGQNQRESFANFSHLAIAFPLGNKWGMGFGIKPYSQIGFDFERSGSVNGTGITYEFDGSGGLNEIFVGTGVQLNENISVGVTGKFLFGKRLETNRVIYGTTFSNYFNTLDQKNLVYNDFAFDLGIQYYKDLELDKRIIFGVTVSPIADISAKESRLTRSYEGREEFEVVKDTVFNVQDRSIDVNIGSKYSGGLGYEYKGKWILMMDYNFIDMENVTIEPGVVATDNHQVSLGFERYTKQSAFGSYFKQMGYRLGAHYYSSLLEIDGNDITDYGMSFGIALPLRKSFSTLNFTVEVGERGSLEGDLVREQYLNFYFGVTINDKWFIKRKYD